MTSWVLGLNGPPIGWHDAAACLVSGDGTVVAYSEEERFNRKKHSPYEPPRQSARFCLETAGITLDDVDVVAYGWDLPHMWPRYGHTWQGQDTIDQMLNKWLEWQPGDKRPEVAFVQHHHAHACCTFYGSPFEDAAVLVNDGNGEDESISLYTATREKGPVLLRSWPRSHSLGYLYDATSRACGLSFLEAGKTMGLAAYGAARGIEPWPTLRFDGELFEPPFSLPGNPDYKEVVAAWMALYEQYGSYPVTTHSSRLVDDEAAVRVAWSAQAAVEEAIARLAAHARSETGIDQLCMAGGVALNCSANGKLPEPLYVPPVPHDAGVALGAAWSICPPTGPPTELSPYLGSPIERADIGPALESGFLPPAVDATTEAVVDRLQRGLVGAIAHGRAEVGPRALCHRSLLALPNVASVRDDVNRRKGRELWRPLSPVALASTGGDLWPSRPLLHRYMLGASQVAEDRRADVPAVVHVDGTARVQTIGPDEPVGRYLEALGAAGLPPVLINTSFNTRGEPVVNNAAEALSAAQAIGVDFLVLEDQLVDLDGYSRS
jgi:carbamoyltransferase